MSTIKEKWAKVKTKVVNAGEKVISKTSKFVEEHPYMAVGLGMIFASGITALASDHDIKKLKESLPDHSFIIEYNDFKNEEDEKNARTIWEENYKDKFNAVKNVFEEMDLAPGESYIIANYDDQKYIYQTDSKNFGYKDTFE